MTAFRRQLDPTIIGNIKKASLFSHHLFPDIEKGKVFPAIRNNRIDFYHGGGKLFSYSKEGFVTHIKYASVLSGGKSYVAESEIANLPHITSFSKEYERIKENCRRYSGVEAQGVSEICRTFGQLLNGKLPLVVPLDIEICFDASDSIASEEDLDRKTDRIDILFYHTEGEDRVLRFCEAKHYSNSEIWAERGDPPRVAKQLSRYRSQISQRKNEIISAYCDHVDSLNKLLGTSLPRPTDIDEEPLFLLVFGFDRNQKDGRLKELLIDDGSLQGHYCYSIGNIEAIKLENMWKGIKPGKVCPPSPVAGTP